MTRAIDGLVNVDMGDREQPDWMVRVKEDYFKGGDSFFKSPELSELIDDMDTNGVERAILLAQVGTTEGRALSFVEARPDRFALGVGGFNLLKPMPTVRALESFVRTTPSRTRWWARASGATACTRRPTRCTSRSTRSAASSTSHSA